MIKKFKPVKPRMEIEKFIQQYSIQDIQKLEHQDPQFLALEKSRNSISSKTDTNKNLFLFLVLQCALVSYQISWWWELWRQEFGQKITQNRNILQNLRQQKQSNTDRRYDFLTTSTYNKRIYNIKTNRLKKFDKILDQTNDFWQYQNNMPNLQGLVSQIMKADKQSKTIVFAIKMIGYAYQTISPKSIEYPIYPMSISIPIDSRIKKIYTTQFPDSKHTDTEIQNYFDKISLKNNIPSLHIDSILWLDYWKHFVKK